MLQEVHAVTLLYAIDTERVGLDADGNNELVVLDGKLLLIVRRFAQYRLTFRIDRACLGLNEVAVGSKGLADGFLDAAEFERTDCSRR